MPKSTLIAFKVIETDNHGGDYPNEKFATPYIFFHRDHAVKVAETFNSIFCSSGQGLRYWKVVLYTYQLKHGFEP